VTHYSGGAKNMSILWIILIVILILVLVGAFGRGRRR
jgi:flagellar basal body-associated protein FliL